ncbi:MAG: heterodisulfide reductase-related iron-sulfur binding cluster, partial [Rhodovibrionaceae bacterium]
FPHLMLRYRAAELRDGKASRMTAELTKTDRNGRLAKKVPGLANWASDTGNGLTRGLLESVAGVDRNADLPKYHAKTFAEQTGKHIPEVNTEAPGHGRKAVLYATCFVNYNNPRIGAAAREVLAKNGVETEVVYPRCCGMPQFEQGDLESVAAAARGVAEDLEPWIDKGYDVIALTPSCALMLKFEWPLIVPGEERIEKLSKATSDVTEYVVAIANKEGLAEGMSPLDGGVAVHISCHSRAQNMGNKAFEMLKLIPEADIKQLPRCSGHGGSWGVLKGNFETALKIGKPVARDVLKAEKTYLASECPLAGAHILQGMERLAEDGKKLPEESYHPIQIFARAYGIEA